MLLKDNLNEIFITFDRNILENLARDERMINYSNLLFKTGSPVIGNFNFLKNFGTLHDLLVDLLKEKIDTDEALEEQSEIINEIEDLGEVLLLKEKSIKEGKTKGAINKEKTKTKRK